MNRNVWIFSLLMVIILAGALGWDGNSGNVAPGLVSTPGTETNQDKAELPDERLNWIYMGGGLVLMIVPWVYYFRKRRSLDENGEH